MVDITVYEEILALHKKDLELVNTIKQVTEVVVELTEQLDIAMDRIRALEAGRDDIVRSIRGH